MKHKSTWIGVAVLAAVLLAGGVWLYVRARDNNPEVLLARLAAGKGDRQELIMRINVAPGDVSGHLVSAFHDTKAPSAFRADALELLCKHVVRGKDQRIDDAIVQALHDADPVVRRRAVHCLAVYFWGDTLAAICDCVNDPDQETRLRAYEYLSLVDNHPEAGMWKLMSPERRGALVKGACQAMDKDSSEEIRDFARSVVAREMEVRAVEATQARQSSDLIKAEKLLTEAMQLDPTNQQGQVRLVRYYLSTGQTEKGLELARQFSACIEVPELPEAPVIDGDPNDGVWQHAYATDRFYLCSSRWLAKPSQSRSKAYIGHRDGRIYVAILGYEKDLGKLIVRHHQRDSEVWNDDCVEIVLDVGNTGKDYYHFIVNSIGAMFDQYDGDQSKNFTWEAKSAVFADRGYWCCEFSVAAKDLDGHTCKSGDIWGLNLFRSCMSSTGEGTGIWPVYGGNKKIDIFPIAIMK